MMEKRRGLFELSPLWQRRQENEVEMAGHTGSSDRMPRQINDSPQLAFSFIPFYTAWDPSPLGSISHLQGGSLMLS